MQNNLFVSFYIRKKHIIIPIVENIVFILQPKCYNSNSNNNNFNNDDDNKYARNTVVVRAVICSIDVNR